jgi:hypothetical protein
MLWGIHRTPMSVVGLALAGVSLIAANPAGGAAVASVSAPTTSSHAAVSPKLPAIDECLEGLLLPTDTIAGWGRDDNTYQLRCGDPTKGLLHIDAGHGPLEGAPGDVFINCLGKIIQFGTDEGPGNPTNSTLFQVSYSSGSGGKAVALVDNGSGDVLTAYTSGTSREWSDCVAG